jgi:hypothetical protein
MLRSDEENAARNFDEGRAVFCVFGLALSFEVRRKIARSRVRSAGDPHGGERKTTMTPLAYQVASAPTFEAQLGVRHKRERLVP